MAELWPTTLPQKLNVQGHNYTFGDPAIRSNPSVGPSKVRPRSSAVSAPLSGQMFLTTAQLAALKTFYNVTVRGADVFVFPDPEAALTSTMQSVLSIIQGQGLTNFLKLLLDAGSGASWPGAPSSKWFDLAGFGYDFFLGADGTTAANDPTFAGAVNGLSLNNYFGFDGGDYFTYDLANEPWMQNIHKDNARFSIVAVVYIPTLASLYMVAGDTNANTQIGFQFYVYTDNKLRFLTTNTTASVNFFATTSIAITAPGWHTVGVSVDEGANSCILMIDGVTQSFPGAYTSPSALAATYTMQIGASGNGASPFGAGGRMATVLMWEGRALTAAELTGVQQGLGNNYALPPMTYLNCRFVSPPVVSATVKAGLWSVGLPMEIVP